MYTQGQVIMLVHQYADELREQGFDVRHIEEVKITRSYNTHGWCMTHRDNHNATIASSKYRIADGEEAVTETILHELCHAIAPYEEKHGDTWQRIAYLVGNIFHVKINARNPHTIKVAEMAYKYHIKCDGCGDEWHYCRRTKFVKAVENNHAVDWKCGCGHKHFSMVKGGSKNE